MASSGGANNPLKELVVPLLTSVKKLDALQSADPQFISVAREMLSTFQGLERVVQVKYLPLIPHTAQLKALIATFLENKKQQNSKDSADELLTIAKLIQVILAKSNTIKLEADDIQRRHSLLTPLPSKISTMVPASPEVLKSSAEQVWRLFTGLKRVFSFFLSLCRTNLNLAIESTTDTEQHFLNRVLHFADEVEILSQGYHSHDIQRYRVESIRHSSVSLVTNSQYYVKYPSEHAAKLRITVILETIQPLIDSLIGIPDTQVVIRRFRRKMDALQGQENSAISISEQSDPASFWKAKCGVLETVLQAKTEVVSGLYKEFRLESSRPNFKRDSISISPVISNTKSLFVVEPEADGEVPPPALHIVPDVYSACFFDKSHTLFLATHLKRNEISVFAILNESKFDAPPGTFDGIHITKKGYQKITVPDPNQKGGIKPFMKYLQTEFSDFEIIQIKDVEANKHLVKAIEVTTPQTRTDMTISVVLCSQGQKNPHEMFQNSATKEFEEFLHSMDIDPTDKESNRNSRWGNLTIKYFVASQLNADEHRRDVGNAPAFIFFKEQGESFDPSEIDKLGMVPQIFAVVQPHGLGVYRVGFFYSGNMHSFLPALPPKFLFTQLNLRNFLLTKIHNGYIQFYYTPPMNVGFIRARNESLEKLTNKKKA